MQGCTVAIHIGLLLLCKVVQWCDAPCQEIAIDLIFMSLLFFLKQKIFTPDNNYAAIVHCDSKTS